MITVLMPVRDCAATAGEAVRSVLAQQGADFEVLVIDDGSTDGTAAVVQAASDARVRVVRRPAEGIVAALNAGLALTDRPFIARMDGDDRMLPGRLARQAALLERRADLAGLGARVRLEPAGGGMARYVDWLNAIETADDVAREAFVEAPLCHPSVMLRTEALRRVGGYRDAGWPEDYDLWLRLLDAGERLAVLPEVLHVWADHPDRLTRRHPRYAAGRFYPLKAHFLVRRLGPSLRIWGAGRDGRRLARALEAEGATLTAFIDIDPRKIGGVRRGSVPVVGPGALRGPGDGPPIVSAVGLPAARADIRARLTTLGYVEGEHFICAA